MTDMTVRELAESSEQIKQLLGGRDVSDAMTILGSVVTSVLIQYHPDDQFHALASWVKTLIETVLDENPRSSSGASP